MDISAEDWKQWASAPITQEHFRLLRERQQALMEANVCVTDRELDLVNKGAILELDYIMHTPVRISEGEESYA